MGLDIESKNKTYHAGYGSLHLVRWLALLTCGFPKMIQGKVSYFYYPQPYIFTDERPSPSAKEFTDMIHSCELAGYRYPNLLLHSDCEGNYTKNGKVLSKDGWITGNSIKLLNELKQLGIETETQDREGRAWETFQMLKDVVEDEIKNGKGIVVFC